MRAEELAALIPDNALLAACSRDELEDLLSRATVQPMKAGATLMEQGEEGDSLVILLAGEARVSMIASNGREIILDYVGPGAVLGEIALLDGKPRTANVCALTPGRMIRFTRPAFEAFIERHPRLAIRMMRAMAQRLRQANDTIENDRAFAAGPRLARYLRRLADGDGERLRHDLSQSELGSFVGISREHVNRQLAAWADAGVIRLDQGRIRVLDHAYLGEVSESGGH
jgi:CRP-like cAMP-binding protein